MKIDVNKWEEGILNILEKTKFNIDYDSKRGEKYNPLSNMTKKQVSNLWRIKEYPKYFRKS